MQAFGRPGSAAEGVGGWGVRGCGAAQMVSKLHMVLRPFLLRRMKAEVDQGLPKKKEIILWAGMAPTQKKFNDALVNKTINELLEQIASSGSGGAVARLKNVLMQLRKNCNHPDLLTGGLDGSISFPPADELARAPPPVRLSLTRSTEYSPPLRRPARAETGCLSARRGRGCVWCAAQVRQCGKLALLDRLLNALKAAGHRVLIFSQMTSMMDLLEHFCQERGHVTNRIDGSMALADRRAQISAFNDPGSPSFVFLLSTRAGGLGINLTSADSVIIYDSDWRAPPARPVYYLPYYSAGYATCYFQLRTQRPEYPPVISPY